MLQRRICLRSSLWTWLGKVRVQWWLFWVKHRVEQKRPPYLEFILGRREAETCCYYARARNQSLLPGTASALWSTGYISPPLLLYVAYIYYILCTIFYGLPFASSLSYWSGTILSQSFGTSWGQTPDTQWKSRFSVKNVEKWCQWTRERKKLQHYTKEQFTISFILKKGKMLGKSFFLVSI